MRVACPAQLASVLLSALCTLVTPPALAAEAAPAEGPMMSVVPAVPFPNLPPEGAATPPRISEERAAPPSIPRTSVDANGPRLSPVPDAARQAELASLRAAVDRAPQGNGRASAAARSAAWQLGLAVLHGIGGPVQPHEARQWFERAFRIGEPMAAAGLAWCAIDGCGSPPDPASARRWIAALRPVDAARAQYFEWLLQTRLAPLQVAGSPRGAGQPAQVGGPLEGEGGLAGRQLLEAAARGGNVHAAIELGLDSLSNRRDEEALQQFRAVAPRSPAAAQNVRILSQRVAATESQQGTALQGPGTVTFGLAQRYHRGDGVPANFSEAVRLYRLAQSQGSDAARRMLELIFSRPTSDGGLDIGWMRQLAQMDVTGASPTQNPAATQPQLRREPTPLFDLLPPQWQTVADDPMR
jgi:TPR repeat protein